MLIDSFGSCVSRDSIEFIHTAKVRNYCARQSIVSAVSNKPHSGTIQALSIREGTHNFHRRCIEHDFSKVSLDLLNQTENVDTPLVVDLIEERMPLAVTKCGELVTYSQAAREFSNINELVERRIPQFSQEYVDLFEKSVNVFADRLKDRIVVIHKAFYAKGDWEFTKANEVLEYFYKKMILAFGNSIAVEVEEEFRISEANHKWGIAPYHYVDAYYMRFVDLMSHCFSGELSVREGFTLRKKS